MTILLNEMAQVSSVFPQSLLLSFFAKSFILPSSTWLDQFVLGGLLIPFLLHGHIIVVISLIILLTNF
jgi:hypothetical protein